MENGVSFGRFIDKRLIAVDDQGALSIETGAFGAVVADVDDEVALEFMLNIEIPDLDVAESVTGIDGEVVGYRALQGAGETIGKSEGRAGGEARDACDVRRGVGEGRLESEILNYDSVLGEVVVDAVTGADDGFLNGLPGNADAWSEIVVVGVDQRLKRRCLNWG